MAHVEWAHFSRMKKEGKSKETKLVGVLEKEGGNAEEYFIFKFLKLLSYFSALHLAVMHGRLNNIRVLLTECNVDAEAFNIR